MNKVKDLLDAQIEAEIMSLRSDDSFEEFTTRVDNIVKLHEMRVAEEKLRQEDVKLVQEDERKTERKLDRILTFVSTVGIAVGGWVTYDAWQKRGLTFEQTGAVVSPWVKNLITKALPK